MLHYFSLLWSFHFSEFSLYLLSKLCLFLWPSIPYCFLCIMPKSELLLSIMQNRTYIHCWRNETFMVKPKYSSWFTQPVNCSYLSLYNMLWISHSILFFLTFHICQTWLKYWEQRRKHNRHGLAELKLFPVWKQR